MPHCRSHIGIMIVPAIGLALLAVGCVYSPVGHWRVNTFEPSSARGAFELAEVRLNRDHTYSLIARCAGQDRESRGAWSMSKDAITFRNIDGSERVYPAKMVDDKHLKVYSEIRGSDVVAVLKRIEPSSEKQEEKR